MPKMLSWKETAKEMGYSVTTLWRECRAGRFPQPVKLSRRRVGFFEDQVHQHRDSLPTAGAVKKSGRL